MLSKSVLLAVSLLALEASAFWRLPCRQRLALERIDPIDSFGGIARHVHTIHGGNNFARSSTNDDLRDSDCTSCSVKEDNSAYWTPNMYWESPDGELTALNQTGGMLVYYLQRGDNLKPFPPDFRVIAGDNRLRDFPWDAEIQKSDWAGAGLSTDQKFLRQKAVGFNCLNYGAPAEAALGLQAIPQGRSCPDGLRAEVFFPSCWNGKDSDSPDHRSHMAYPSTMDNGECPPGFETRLPSLFFETIWDVNAVAGLGGRLVFSNGDPTGYGYHGDFMNGWQQDVLERAINVCTDPSGVVEKCYEFTFNTEEEYSQCIKKPELDEQVWGPLDILPGCNMVTDGPEYSPLGGCKNGDKDITVESKPKSKPKPKPKSKPESKSKPSPKPESNPAPKSPPKKSGSKPAQTGSDDEAAPKEGGKDTIETNEADKGKENDDPYLVIVTVTTYEYEQHHVTKTVREGEVYETVTADPQVVTVTGNAAAKRHLVEHGKRRNH